jgi:hypothetical protein
VAVVPSRNGIDGGMNPVFEAKLATHTNFDNNGRVYQVAGSSQAPGALPRTPNPPAPTVTWQDSPPQTSEPAVLASVPMPQPAPQAKVGEAPREQPQSIGGLIGTLFGGSPPVTKPTEPAENQAIALRGSQRDTGKKKHVAPVRAAAAPAAPQRKPHETAPAQPKAVASTAPAPAQQAGKKDKPPQPELRTAYSTPQASNNGVLPGAQPVVPAGTFESRWTALR